MASMPPATGPEDGESSVTATSAVDEQTINVQVLSPSNGVTGPLLFPGLAANTTVKQLKDKIRQSLPLRPADENQRLIHRGRAIVRESDTLFDIFGADAVRNPEQHTIHLVIRDVHDSQTSASTAPSALPNLAAPGPAPAPARGPSPTASAPPTNPPRAQPQHAHFHGQPFGYQIPWRNTMPPTSNPFPQPRMPSPSPTHTPEQAAAFQHQHQNMTQWLTNIQREAMARALNQNQRTRAQMGMRGVGDNGTGAVPTSERSGRASPAPGQTIYREHVGPNGHTTYQVQTFTSSGGSGQQGHGSAAVSMSPADVHNIIRSADVNQVTSAATSAMQRSASSTSLHNRPLTQPGMTAPVYPHGYSAMSSRRGTPEPASTRLAPTAASGSSQSRQGPEVYILSSPEGPRALLFNNTSSEAYYTPRLRTQTSLPQLRQTMLNPLQESFNAQMRHRHHHHHHHHPRPHVSMQQHLGQMPPQAQPHYPQSFRPLVQQPMPQQEPAVQGQAPVQAQAQGQGQVQNQGQEPEPGAFMGPLMHRGNPPMGALPPLLIQLWPQIWLLFRLALFVWFFTSPNASWSRWFTIIVVAVFIFVLSTGVLNGVPDHVWRPLGRHLENLIPLDPRGQGAAAPEQRNQQNPQPRQDPDPTEMARRLVAQHQGQENWVISQVRRLERAGLLFLASIAPGVAERHIANLEAAARAERERIEAEAREAEAAAAAQNDENGETRTGEGDEATTTGIEADQVERAPEDREEPPVEQGVQGENQHGEREPLIQL